MLKLPLICIIKTIRPYIHCAIRYSLHYTIVQSTIDYIETVSTNGLSNCLQKVQFLNILCWISRIEFPNNLNKIHSMAFLFIFYSVSLAGSCDIPCMCVVYRVSGMNPFLSLKLSGTRNWYMKNSVSISAYLIQKDRKLFQPAPGTITRGIINWDFFRTQLIFFYVWNYDIRLTSAEYRLTDEGDAVIKLVDPTSQRSGTVTVWGSVAASESGTRRHWLNLYNHSKYGNVSSYQEQLSDY